MLEKEVLLQNFWETKWMKYYLDFYLQHRDDLFLQMSEMMTGIQGKEKEISKTEEPIDLYYRYNLGDVELPFSEYQSMKSVLNSLFGDDYMDFMESYGDTYDYDGGIILYETKKDHYNVQARLQITIKPIKQVKSKKRIQNKRK